MYSGTVSGALEGTILGIPSMAVSQEGDETFRFDVGARVCGSSGRRGVAAWIAA